MALRSPGRVGYVIAGLEPTARSARALLDFAALYAGSESGAVPYKQWPPELKGHFLCRFPAAPLDAPSIAVSLEDLGVLDIPPEAALP